MSDVRSAEVSESPCAGRTPGATPPRGEPLDAARGKIAWLNVLFLVGAHLMAAAAVAYLIFVQFSWWSVGLSVLWLGLCGISMTGGYHRLFSHPTYRCIAPLRFFYLLFGAASVQNSALQWSSDHRRHHGDTDGPDDPYNITRGFWWAHMGWIFYKSEPSDFRNVSDLQADPLVRFQHRWYLPIALIVAGLVPAALGMAWGDAAGAFLLAGFLRLTLQYHATFSINSVAHCIGRQPYSRKVTARDSFVTALLTLGEGYHNFHHRFPADYRNGIRAWHFDPTKWWVWGLSLVGVTRELHRVAPTSIQRAKEEARLDAQRVQGGVTGA